MDSTWIRRETQETTTAGTATGGESGDRWRGRRQGRRVRRPAAREATGERAGWFFEAGPVLVHGKMRCRSAIFSRREVVTLGRKRVKERSCGYQLLNRAVLVRPAQSWAGAPAPISGHLTMPPEIDEDPYGVKSLKYVCPVATHGHLY